MSVCGNEEEAEWLLRDAEAAKGFFEKSGLFKAPELLKKHVIAIEVTIEVLYVFLAHVFGTQRASVDNSSSDLKTLWEGLGCFSVSDRKGTAGEDLSARAHDPDNKMEAVCEGSGSEAAALRCAKAASDAG